MIDARNNDSFRPSIGFQYKLCNNIFSISRNVIILELIGGTQNVNYSAPLTVLYYQAFYEYFSIKRVHVLYRYPSLHLKIYTYCVFYMRVIAISMTIVTMVKTVVINRGSGTR